MARGKPIDEFSLAPGNPAGDTKPESGNGNGDSINSSPAGTIDPAEFRGTTGEGGDFTGGTNKDGSPTRKRGRKSGSASNGPKAQNPSDIGAIQATLISVHALLAQKIPEMEINETEAQRLAEGIARVEKYYPAVSAVISGRIADHIAFASTLVAVYGIRFAAIKIRKEREGKNSSRGTDSVVIDMPQRPQNPAAE